MRAEEIFVLRQRRLSNAARHRLQLRPVTQIPGRRGGGFAKLIEHYNQLWPATPAAEARRDA
jgi:hypothetical protein